MKAIRVNEDQSFGGYMSGMDSKKYRQNWTSDKEWKTSDAELLWDQIKDYVGSGGSIVSITGASGAEYKDFTFSFEEGGLTGTEGIGSFEKGDPNFFVTSATDWDKEWALKGGVIQANLTLGVWKVIYAKDAEDAYNQIDAWNKDHNCNGTIGNIVFDSHGKYDKAQFRVGNQIINKNTARTNKNLNKIGQMMSKSSQVLLLACHVGSFDNGGSTLLTNLAINMGAQTYGCQSWTSPKPFMFKGADMAYKDPEYMNNDGSQKKPGREYAIKNYGNWTTGMPFNGGIVSEVGHAMYVGMRNGRIDTFFK